MLHPKQIAALRSLTKKSGTRVSDHIRRSIDEYIARATRKPRAISVQELRDMLKVDGFE